MRACATTSSSWRRLTPTRTTSLRGSASPGCRSRRGEPWCGAAAECSSIVCRFENVPTCAAAGINNGCRPNPNYANNNQYSSEGESNYHGLHVSFVQRPATWGHYRISYTFSKSMNNVGETFFSAPIDPTDLSKDWGRSDNDQRHRLVVSGAMSLPYRFNVSGALQAYSSLPFNIVSGVTTI